jgi:exosome complex component RRP4
MSIKSGSIVVPGMIVAKDDRVEGDNTIRADRGIVATHIGVVSRAGKRVSVIPRSGPYLAKKGDFVIGVISGYGPNGWFVDIGTAHRSYLPAKEVMKRGRFDPTRDELSEMLGIGDVVSAKVLDAGRQGYTLLTMKERGLEKMKDGWFMKVQVSKIPRLIGKKGSMLKILREGGKVRVFIGQNGVVAILGSRESFLRVKPAIELIEHKTFAKGLTEEVAVILNLKASSEK